MPFPGVAITYAYEELGRLVSALGLNASAETFAYDQPGRLTEHASDLGHFTIAYLGETGQPLARQLSGQNIGTGWDYLGNEGDRRLAGINDAGVTPTQYCNFHYETFPGELISRISTASDAPRSAPDAKLRLARYNALNQLIQFGDKAFAYDANGNLVSDGDHTFEWDAENRLVKIAYPKMPGKMSTLSYDGFGRPTSERESNSGGATVEYRYLWCGAGLCQRRDADNNPTRSYFLEGELELDLEAVPYYYGVDNMNSVRRAFIDAATAPAYDYNPFGALLQSGQPLTDFGFAGMLHGRETSFQQATYRTYGANIGRWISRDPIGVSGGINLYAYADNDPINFRDPAGLARWDYGYVPDNALPISSRFMLRDHRALAEGTDGQFRVEYTIPNDWLWVHAPEGGGFICYPPGVPIGSKGNVVRIQPPGTASATPGRQYANQYPTGYFTVYGPSGQAISIYTGKPDVRDATHNPIGYIGPHIVYPLE